MVTDEIIICVLSSTVAATFVTSIKELFLWRLNRSAKLADEGKEDKEAIINKKLEEQQEAIKKVSDAVEKLGEKIDVSCRSSKVILQNLIKTLIMSHLEEGEVSFEDRKLIHEMWTIYHYGLGGNGDLDDLMDLFDELPLKM